MSRIITREDVLKLAHMSRLIITEEEIPFYTAQLEARLSYTTCLQTILAEHAELVARLHEKAVAENIMRDDQVFPTESEPLLAQAPQREENFFVVPVVVKQTK